MSRPTGPPTQEGGSDPTGHRAEVALGHDRPTRASAETPGSSQTICKLSNPRPLCLQHPSTPPSHPLLLPHPHPLLPSLSPLQHQPPSLFVTRWTLGGNSGSRATGK